MQAERSKRTLLLAVAGLGAAALGAWWGLRQRPSIEADSNEKPLISSQNQVTEAFWSLKFEDPDGQTHTLQQWQGQSLIVNFWASWCPPCVHEMPELDQFHQQFEREGWHVIGLAVDNATSVRDFLSKKSVHFPILIAGFAGTELARSLGNQTGGLPFTVAIDPQGVVKERISGPTSLNQLREFATPSAKHTISDR